MQGTRVHAQDSEHLQVFFSTLYQKNYPRHTLGFKLNKRSNELQGYSPFQGLHLTHGIPVLVDFSNFTFSIPSLQWCFKYKYLLLYLGLCHLYIMHPYFK